MESLYEQIAHGQPPKKKTKSRPAQKELAATSKNHKIREATVKAKKKNSIVSKNHSRATFVNHVIVTTRQTAHS